ncbi:MAG TPA: NADP-dependent oxidoreductase [Ktedonobacterales bacterium]|nr:NADP-dependent oxidoreductase [Ktedonobacterales bacterium]
MADSTMQAIRVHRYGGPEQLVLEQVARPEPQAGEVLVRIDAAGVLPIEWKVRQGLIQRFQPASFPYIPGSAFAGVVEQAGLGVEGFESGQAVFGRSNNGTYAEYTVASVDTIAAKPEVLTFDEAAAISGGATVAWTSLFDNGELQAGQHVLVTGAAGGVGSFSVQFARWKGARVIGTASAANLEFVRSLGAETVVDYTTTPFEQVVHDVDLVLDAVGGETLRRAMGVVKPGGVLVSLLEQPSQEQARARGIRAMHNAVAQPFPSSDLLRTIAELIVSGQISVTLGPIFALRAAALAHELSQRGHGRGRIALRIIG